MTEQLVRAFEETLKLAGNPDQENSNLLKEFDVPGLDQIQDAFKHQWLVVSSRFPEGLDKLNEHLKSRTYLLDGLVPTTVDAIVFARALQHVKGWTQNEIVAFRHVVRWADQVQNVANISESQRLKVDVNVVAPRELRQKPEKKGDSKGDNTDNKAHKKADKKADSKADNKSDTKSDKTPKTLPEGVTPGVKKPKKEKKPQPVKEEVSITPGMVDLRVGHIEKAVKHPDADSLYVSTIHMGDPDGPRTVCSGLVKYFPLEAMQDRMVVVVANLKPVSMRGIKSQAMVLCASDENTVEFVNPPLGSKAGDKIFFEGYDITPETQLNPKKKIWETVQPGFTTTSDLNVIYKKEGDSDRKLVNKNGELCKVNSLINAQVR